MNDDGGQRHRPALTGGPPSADGLPRPYVLTINGGSSSLKFGVFAVAPIDPEFTFPKRGEALRAVIAPGWSGGHKWADRGWLEEVEADLGEEVPLSLDDLEIMIIMPDATDTGAAGPGLQAVLQHEMGHVATLLGTDGGEGSDYCNGSPGPGRSHECEAGPRH